MTLRSIAFEVLSVARYGTIVVGIFLMFFGVARNVAGDDDGRIEWMFLLAGASALLTAIPARLGLRVLKERWGLTPVAVDPSVLIRERAFEHRRNTVPEQRS
jgi:hypothetical protein